MSKKKDDEKSPKSSKKIIKQTDYNLAKSAICKKMREQQIQEMHKNKAAVGRPTLYNEERAQYILDRVASTSVGLKTLCKEDPKMPDHDTVNLWRWKHPEFSSQYLVAKQMQAHLLAEACEEEAKEKYYYQDATGAERVDPGFIASQRLIVDTKKWHASKIAPTFYGDRKLVDEIKTDHESMKSELMALRAQLDEKNKKEY